MADGIIGSDILWNMTETFDLAHDQITFYTGLAGKTDVTPGVAVQLGFGGAMPVRLTEKGLLYTLPVRVTSKGKSVTEEMRFDTGSDFTYFSLVTAEKLAFVPVRQGTGQTFGGQYRAASANVDSVEVGGISVFFPLVQYTLDEKSVLPPVLGVDILKRFKVLVDMQSHVAYFQPVPTDKPAKDHDQPASH